jgi:hypothetical protein
MVVNDVIHNHFSTKAIRARRSTSFVPKFLSFELLRLQISLLMHFHSESSEIVSFLTACDDEDY